MSQLVAVLLENNPLDHRQTNNPFMYYKSDVKSRRILSVTRGKNMGFTPNWLLFSVQTVSPVFSDCARVGGRDRCMFS